ncbi:sirohydrochlorin chelatase [Bacillus marinisedimentorum]|uniref:sirohydrochlorin chelatase n=1 Tax=Bacillus marinisedimentorum TaxID=1821260 RepID=UPI000873083C|nr:sirohydrochlorin chelatase [Bacillus marinisedimentorum]
MDAILYIGHGSRTEAGNRQFAGFIGRTSSRVKAPIQEFAFLELAAPSIEQGIGRCIERGASRIIAMPVLLSSGIHALVDIPSALERAEDNFPEVEFVYGDVLSKGSGMAGILAGKLAEKGFRSDGTEAVLLTGHGSRTDESAKELEKLAEELMDNQGSGTTVRTCYLKEAQPSYQDALGNLVQEPFDTIYILPYLLFTGKFTERMEKTAAEVQRSSPSKNLVMCDPVGFDAGLEELLAGLAAAGDEA